MSRLASNSTSLALTRQGRAHRWLIVLACLFVGLPLQLATPSLLTILPVEQVEETECERAEADLFRRSRCSMRLSLHPAPLSTAETPIRHVSVADRDKPSPRCHVSSSRRVELIGAGIRMRC
ncbi:MAG: hypothetical protein K8T89_17475 [Planctomycetes bacterium]|nr:hypothetical protein [Planctomycetota bacterium]